MPTSHRLCHSFSAAEAPGTFPTLSPLCACFTMTPIAGCPTILNRPQPHRAVYTCWPPQDTARLLISVLGAQDVAEATAKATKNVIPIFYNLWQGDMLEYGPVAPPAFTLHDPAWHPHTYSSRTWRRHILDIENFALDLGSLASAVINMRCNQLPTGH